MKKNILIIFFLVFSIDGMEPFDRMGQLEWYHAIFSYKDFGFEDVIQTHILPYQQPFVLDGEPMSRHKRIEKYKSLCSAVNEESDDGVKISDVGGNVTMIDQIDFVKKIKDVILNHQYLSEHKSFRRNEQRYKEYKKNYLESGAEKDFLNDLESTGICMLKPTKKIIINDRFSFIEYAVARKNSEIFIAKKGPFLLYFLQDSYKSKNNCFIDTFFDSADGLIFQNYIFPQVLSVKNYHIVDNFFNSFVSEMFVFHPGGCELGDLLFNSAEYYNKQHAMLEDKYTIPKYMLHIFHKNIELVKPFLKNFMYGKSILLSYITKARSTFIDYVIEEQSDSEVEAIVNDEWLFPKKMKGSLDAAMILFVREHKEDLISLQLLQSRKQKSQLKLYKKLNEKIDALMHENKELQSEKNEYAKVIQSYAQAEDEGYSRLENQMKDLVQRISDIECDKEVYQVEK